MKVNYPKLMLMCLKRPKKKERKKEKKEKCLNYNVMIPVN